MSCMIWKVMLTALTDAIPQQYVVEVVADTADEAAERAARQGYEVSGVWAEKRVAGSL